jgi:Trypsin
MRQTDGTPSICTAFLIAPNLVMTAAHCISPGINWLKEKVEVECGQSGFDEKAIRLETTTRGTPLIAEGVIFDEKHRIVSHIQDDSSDQAILKQSLLNGPLKYSFRILLQLRSVGSVDTV